VRSMAVPAPLGASPAVARLTLTLAERLASRTVAVVLQGAAKHATFEAAARSGDPRRFPVAALLERARRAAGTDPAIEFLWCP